MPDPCSCTLACPDTASVHVQHSLPRRRSNGVRCRGLWLWLLTLGVALSLAGEAGAQSTPAAEAKPSAEAPLPSLWDAPEPWRTDRFYVQTSLYTIHFNSDPDHVNNQKLIYGEWRTPYRWLAGQVIAGAAFFDNSFGQPSQFVFGGLLWRPVEKAQELYFKVGAGILHGYTGEYEDKVPYNHNGWSPGIVPAVGYCYSRFCGEMMLFGTAGMMWTLGMTLP